MIHLIRHGETTLNAARVLQPPETPLSERGRRQAERLALRLRESGIVHVISSDLPRAQATAELLCRVTGAELTLEPLLQERSFGELRGTAYSELGRDVFAQDYRPPGGEDGHDFDRRVDAAWERIVERAARLGAPLAVVTHGLVCRSLTLRRLRLPPGQEPVQRFRNTSLTLAQAVPPHAVELIDCTRHLEGLEAEGLGA